LYYKKIRINNQITAPELRVVTDDAQNLGVISLSEALRVAKEQGLDLIEISATAVPPVAKIMDFGKYQYLENKKQKVAKANAHVSELKMLQVKVGTGEHDLALKAKRATEFLQDGHRVHIELFLKGRNKYMEFNFLKERLERILVLISEPYKITDSIKKSMKGLAVTIEKQ